MLAVSVIYSQYEPTITMLFSFYEFSLFFHVKKTVLNSFMNLNFYTIKIDLEISKFKKYVHVRVLNT